MIRLSRVNLDFSTAGDIPFTKLAALQKVLQSDFFSAVREVYEHIYDTVDIQVSLIFQAFKEFFSGYLYN